MADGGFKHHGVAAEHERRRDATVPLDTTVSNQWNLVTRGDVALHFDLRHSKSRDNPVAQPPFRPIMGRINNRFEAIEKDLADE